MFKILESTQVVKEIYGGDSYDYYPLGKDIVIAPAVCGGRPTFKYTRLEVDVILALLSSGRTIDEVVQAYRRSELTAEAVQEALQLAQYAFSHTTEKLLPLAV